MVTLAELRAEAKRQKRKGYSKLKKAELEKLLETPPPKPPRGIPRKKPEASISPPKKPTTPPKKPTTTVKKKSTKIKQLTGLKKFGDIKFKLYDRADDKNRGGFLMDTSKFYLKGEIDKSIRNRILIDKFVNDPYGKGGLPKGEPTKILCGYLSHLVDERFVSPDMRVVLYADPSFGRGQKKGGMDKLVKFYETLGFKKFGQVAFGNQPLEASVREVIEACKKKM